MGNPKQKWSQEEEECLRAAVAKYGTGLWKTIKNDPEFTHLLDSRSNIDLKDKWRNMSVSANGQGLKGKSETPKSKGNTNCRATQAEIAETPDSLSLPVVDQVSTDVHISDASKCVLDDKIASKQQSFSDMDIDDHDIDEEEFEFSRNYFLAKESGKSGKKSARKLSEIDIVDEQDLRAEVSSIEQKHEKEIASLINSYKSLYNEWVFELRYGFGLLLYGFGSKKTLIEDFASTALTEYSVIVVNGYLQSINLKQVAMTMAEVLWDQLKSQPGSASGGLLKSQQPFNSRSMDDLISFLDGPHAPENECFVCLVIHNIDGPGLRDSDSQNLLARIAACSHVRVVASIDHVNAPLLWDKKMVHVQFNWCWHHVPTFSPYKVEGVFHPLILAHGGASQSVKTAVIVLQSLTPNAQSVFKVLAEHQLAHPDEEGMPIDALFTSCRERFLVSSLVTLNSHLTEFKDHELVKIRRHSDGQDCFYIPLSKDALEKLVQEINQ